MSETEWSWREKYEEDDKYLPVPRCLLKAGDLSISAALVYAAIADDDIDGDNIAKMQYADIIGKTGLSRRKVADAIKELIAQQLLEPEPVRTGRANVYRVTVRLLPPVPQRRKHAAEERAAKITCSENAYFRNLPKQG